MSEILFATLAFLIFVAVVSVVSVLIMIMIWWMFRNNMDFENMIDTEEWEEAEQFAKETEREIVRMTKRDGHQFWWSEGREFEPLKPTVAWYGDTFEAFESQDQWWESEKEFLQELFANGISSEAFKDEINRLIEIYNTFDGLEDNEQVVTESHAFPEIVPIETMRWHDKDVTDYVIAVK